MADAKECDVCGKLYKKGTENQPYLLLSGKTHEVLDTCQDCDNNIAKLFQKKSKGKGKRGGYKGMSDEAKKRIADNTKKMQAEAKRLRQENPGLLQGEALKQASKNLQEGPKSRKRRSKVDNRQFEKIGHVGMGSGNYKKVQHNSGHEEKDLLNDDKHICPMCQYNRVRKEGEMCHDCSKLFEAGK